LNNLKLNGIFITGTDTEVGKTIVSAAIILALRKAGVDAVYMKPVQTGCRKRGRQLIASDLETVCKLAGIHPSAKEKQLMAPCRFARTCSPHLAAGLEKRTIRLSRIMQSFSTLKRRHGFVVVEGAGGILVPLSEKHTMLDLMRVLALPVIIVARPGLGTINHTLLTIRELRRAGVQIRGIILSYAVKASKTYIENDNRRMIEKLGRVRVIAELPYSLRVSQQRLDSTNFLQSGTGPCSYFFLDIKAITHLPNVY
jgi:dethiobiotin synthetase